MAHDLIAALVAGYETALRIGRDHAADLSARGFRTTPTYGVFGAAAAAGRLLGLDERTMTHALALAANMAGGLREYSESGSEDFAVPRGHGGQQRHHGRATRRGGRHVGTDRARREGRILPRVTASRAATTRHG